MFSVEWLLASAASVLLCAVSLAWWLGQQFSKQDVKFGARIDDLYQKISDKLEYHERHDDARFSAIQQDIQARATSVMNDIWTLKLNQASRMAKEDLEDCRK
jgi:hypothetical protein